MSLGVPSISIEDDADVPGNRMPLHLSRQPMLVKPIERSEHQAPEATEPSIDSRPPPANIRLAQIHQRALGPEVRRALHTLLSSALSTNRGLIFLAARKGGRSNPQSDLAARSVKRDVPRRRGVDISALQFGTFRRIARQPQPLRLAAPGE